MQDGTAFGRLDPAGEDRFQRLRADLGVETFGLNLIRLAPGARGRIHAHERQEEVYVVLEGTLTLAFGADDERSLPAGDCARVAPGIRRQLVNRGRDRCVLLAMGGAEPHDGRDGVAFEAWDGEGRPPQDVPFPPDLPV